MKIRKRVLAICLAVMLITAMAIPVAARTVIQSYDYGGFTFSVSDTCNASDFYIIMKSHTDECVMQTDVGVLLVRQYNGSNAMYMVGSPSTQITFNSANVCFPIAHIECYHFVDGDQVDTVIVEPG